MRGRRVGRAGLVTCRRVEGIGIPDGARRREHAAGAGRAKDERSPARRAGAGMARSDLSRSMADRPWQADGGLEPHYGAGRSEAAAARGKAGQARGRGGDTAASETDRVPWVELQRSPTRSRGALGK
ncbi:hypothetical protein GCM10010964_44010 [Caldovatus sediminis]|uniref:Uncharacterized protein n=1 Tax=Caldovatus sediminis TaxID=2041189 RepID=A0A8J3ED37_9PROT|nr:hypothetical protein GCM10010964_44010 [Caldovatus sediminis]